ncbi:MAG: PrsW family glutamic-type intramembrane protease [Methanoregula sp.]
MGIEILGGDAVLLAAYLFPILFLMAFIGHEGKKYLIYLVWGIVVSIPVIILYDLITTTVPLSILPYPELVASPLLEEFFKALPIIIPAIMGIKNSNRDLLVYAMAVGIGFSLLENWHTIDPASLMSSCEGLDPELFTSCWEGNILTVLGLSFSTSLLHGCTCGIIGYGIVLIRNFDRKALPVLLFGFYTLAVTIHAIYNLLWVRGSLIDCVIDFSFPLVLFFFLLTCYQVDLPSIFKREIEE